MFKTLSILLKVPTQDAALLREKFAALSRTLPLLYVILASNIGVLGASFLHDAPLWLSGLLPLALVCLCVTRLVHWWRRRNAPLSDAQIAAALVRANRLGAVLGLLISSWSLTLVRYGNPVQQAHVAFSLTVTMLGSVVCLSHLRSTSMFVAAFIGVPSAVFFATSGQPDLVSMSITMLLVLMATVIMVFIQNRDFRRMVDDRRRVEALGAENQRLANLDSLTGIPNRRAFFTALERSVRTAAHDQGHVALGIIDLDGFKAVNDLYGHSTGDRLLTDVGARLAALHFEAQFHVFRLGGDEFAFLMPCAPGTGALTARGEEIARILTARYTLPEAVIQISASIGMAVFPDMSASPTQLYERADYALYHGKNTKRGTATLFSAGHEARINRDASIEQALKQADLEAELSVVFQPIVSLKQRKAEGFEALARWDSPALGNVPPSQFIPVAERAGIIPQLSHLLLRKALATAVQWPTTLRLAFNVSAHDLNVVENALEITSIIQTSGFDPLRLDLEITETAFALDTQQLQNSIDMLRTLGCGISLDDFGTGYSSLSRLHALPLTKIKIDRSFVTDLHRTPASHKIVKSLLALSRDMGVDCVVEGVEKQEEINALSELGALMIQGYYFSRPMRPEEIPAFLQQPLKNHAADRTAGHAPAGAARATETTRTRTSA